MLCRYNLGNFRIQLACILLGIRLIRFGLGNRLCMKSNIYVIRGRIAIYTCMQYEPWDGLFAYETRGSRGIIPTGCEIKRKDKEKR